MDKGMTEKQRTGLPKRILIRKNDVVKVISGRDKGKTGRVLSVNRDAGKLLVEHVMLIKRHTRPNPAKNIKGGIVEKEAPVHASNVQIVCSGCGKHARIGHQTLPSGSKVRACKRCGATLDK